MKPTETLTREHRAIQQMCEIIRTAAKKLEAGELKDLSVFAKAIDFFRNFADRCHHSKEERLLFVKLVEKGIPKDGGPVGVMLAEHDLGRSHIRGMDEALRRLEAEHREAAADLVEHALAYADLLSNHIQKEDNILFVLADRILDEAEQRELAEAFARLEAEEMGDGTHERYHRILEELRKEVLASP